MRDTKKKLEKVLELYINNRKDEAEQLLHEAFIDKARDIHDSMQLENEMIDETDVMKDLVFAGIAGAITFGPMLLLAIANELSRFFSRHKDDDHQLEEQDEPDESTAIANKLCELIGCSMDSLPSVIQQQLKTRWTEMSPEQRKEVMQLAMQLTQAERDQRQFITDLNSMVTTPEQEAVVNKIADALTSDTAISESLILDIVRSDLYAGGDRDHEVGSGKFAKPNSSKTSPVAGARSSRMGAKPVTIGKGPHARNFDREHAPRGVYNSETGARGLPKGTKADNRRKKSMDDTSNLASGEYGARRIPDSRLETTQDEFKTGKSKSPFYKVNTDDK
jgi:hypothetical protein